MKRVDVRIGPGTVVRAVLIALALLGLAMLLWAGRNILFILFLGVLVGVFLSVFVDGLESVGVPRPAGVLVTVSVLAGLIAAFSLLLWPTVRDQLAVVGRDLPELADQAAAWLDTQFRGLTGRAGLEVNDLEEEIRASVSEQAGTIVGGALPIINTAMGAVAGLLVALAVGIYTAANPGMYRGGFERLIPPAHRSRIALTLDRTRTSLRRWMVGTLVNMVIVGTMVGVALWLLGVPAAIALAVIAGVFEFIPIVGPILASVPAIALGFTVSPMTALWVTVLFIAVQQIESNVTTPLIMRGAVHLPPALTVLFQAFMAVIFGFPGLLLAVPILAVAMAAVRTLYIEPMEAEAAAEPATTEA